MTGYSTALLLTVLFATPAMGAELPPDRSPHASSADTYLQQPGREELRLACNAAGKPADYEEFEGVIPADFKNTVLRYKRLWTRHCGDAETAVPFADLAEGLDDLLEEFSAINDDAYSHDLWKTAQSHRRSHGDADDTERYLRFDEMVCERFPLFIPVFKCRPAHLGASFFDKPSQHALAQIAQVRGNAEDRLFFRGYDVLDGDPNQRDAPWEEIYSEIHGSCIYFREFDWPGAFRTLQSLRLGVTRPSYRQKVDAIEKNMLAALDGNRSPGPESRAAHPNLICSCEPKDDALAAYAQLAIFLVSEPGYEALARRIESTRREIESGQLPFINDREQNCRGG